jgi:hypothetical protein
VISRCECREDKDVTDDVELIDGRTEFGRNGGETFSE